MADELNVSTAVHSHKETYVGVKKEESIEEVKDKSNVGLFLNLKDYWLTFRTPDNRMDKVCPHGIYEGDITTCLGVGLTPIKDWDDAVKKTEALSPVIVKKVEVHVVDEVREGRRKKGVRDGD